MRALLIITIDFPKWLCVCRKDEMTPYVYSVSALGGSSNLSAPEVGACHLPAYFHECVVTAGTAADLLKQLLFSVHLLWLLEIILDPILRPLGKTQEYESK